MANPKHDTGKIIEELGGKQIWPPRKLRASHLTTDALMEWPKGKKALLGVMTLDVGDYLMELSYDGALQDFKNGIGPSSYYEVNKKTLDALMKHPRADEIFG